MCNTSALLSETEGCCVYHFCAYDMSTKLVVIVYVKYEE